MKLHSLYRFPILIAIFVLALGLRSFWLDRAPVGALVDESHFGYLAYSLNETGMDEHGEAYPLLFRGFGDQKLPMGAYLMMPVVKVFGLSNETIRYPSILVGSLLTLSVYFLLKQLKFREDMALVGALVVAISPWTFFLSRFGFESNLALFFFTTGLIFLVKGMQSDRWKDMIPGGILVGLTWYSYVAYRPVTVVVPLAVLAVMLFLKKIKLKTAAVFFVAMGITILPLFQPGLLKANTTRVNQVGILTDPGLKLLIDENRTFCAMRAPRAVCDLTWNKGTVVGRELVARYFETYSPQFLVSRGEEVETFLTVEGFGQFYLVLYPFILIGIAVLFLPQVKLKPELRWLLITGLLLAPIPALIVGQAQKVRISVLFPFILLAAMVGWQQLGKLFKHQLWQLALCTVVVLGMLGQSALYFSDYFTVHVVKNEYSYQSYLPELFDYIQSLEPDAQVTIKPFFSDPLMFYAYYTHMDPTEYQQQAVLGELEASGFQHTVELGRIFAKEESLEEVACQAHAEGVKGYLVTDRDLEGYEPVREIKATNGVHTYAFIYEATKEVGADNCPDLL